MLNSGEWLHSISYTIVSHEIPLAQKLLPFYETISVSERVTQTVMRDYIEVFSDYNLILSEGR